MYARNLLCHPGLRLIRYIVMFGDSGVQRHSCYLQFRVTGLTLRDQREPIGGADQLLVHEFLDSEIRKLLAVARSLDATERQVRRADRGVVNENHPGFDSAGDTFSVVDVLG